MPILIDFGSTFESIWGTFSDHFHDLMLKPRFLDLLKDLSSILQDFKGSEARKIHQNQVPIRVKITFQNHANSSSIFLRFLEDFWSKMGPL